MASDKPSNQFPADADMPPARFDLSIFDQRQVWVTQEGEQRSLADLHPSDRRDLVEWLKRNVRHFYLQVLARSLGVDALASGRVPEALFVSAEEWMSSTALLAELSRPRDDLAEMVGPFWSVGRTARRLALDGSEEVLALADVGALLVVIDGSGVPVCPSWQFVQAGDSHWLVAAGFRIVMSFLKDVGDPWSVALILSVPAPELNDQVPRDLLGAGAATADLEALRLFARRVAAEWRV